VLVMKCIEPLTADPFGPYQSLLTQDPQLMRDGRLFHPQRLGEIANERAPSSRQQESDPTWRRQREHGIRQSFGHGSIEVHLGSQRLGRWALHNTPVPCLPPAREPFQGPLASYRPGCHADGSFASASFKAAINSSSWMCRCFWISIASLRIASASL